MSAALGNDLEAKQAAEQKAKVLANIQATRTDYVGTGKREYDYMQTHLRNKGVSEPLSELVWKTQQEIDQIFAASNLNSNDRVATKRFMGRIGALGRFKSRRTNPAAFVASRSMTALLGFGTS